MALFLGCGPQPLKGTKFLSLLPGEHHRSFAHHHDSFGKGGKQSMLLQRNVTVPRVIISGKDSLFEGGVIYSKKQPPHFSCRKKHQINFSIHRRGVINCPYFLTSHQLLGNEKQKSFQVYGKFQGLCRKLPGLRLSLTVLSLCLGRGALSPALSNIDQAQIVLEPTTLTSSAHFCHRLPLPSLHPSIEISIGTSSVTPGSGTSIDLIPCKG